jgi:hypothetical protein
LLAAPIVAALLSPSVSGALPLSEELASLVADV